MFILLPIGVFNEDHESILKRLEFLKSSMLEQCRKFGGRAGNRAVLMSYSSDGIPLTTMQRWILRTSQLRVQRVGRSCVEYLIQRAFFSME